MKKVLFFLGAAMLSFSSCTNDFNEPSHEGTATNVNKDHVINKSGAVDGVTYNLRNLSVNPDLIKISSENSVIMSSETDLKDGKYKLKIDSPELTEKIVSGNLIYLTTNDSKVYFRKIAAVNQQSDVYTIETSDAYIGDLFTSGSIELVMDTQETERALKAKSTSLITAKGSYDNTFTYDIFNYIKEYKSDFFTLNPNTSVKSTFNVKISFGKSKILPDELEVYYQIDSKINPFYTFAGAVNKKYSYNLINNAPTNLLDLLKKVEIDVTIPGGDLLGDIPAKISIDEISFPMDVEANVSKASHFAINSNGTFKIGFANYINVPGKTSHFIYENSITNAKVTESDLVGEVISDMKISIKPKVKLLDSNILDVKGNITYGINSFTIGNGSMTNPSAFASKGNFYSQATFAFGALGLTFYTTDLFKENKELWNIGNFNKTMTFSNFRTGKASLLPCSGLYSYGYDVTLDYKYPISGKVVSGDLEITYDVYADNGTVLESNKTIKISPKDITSNSVKFNLCIPFRKINILSVAKTSYIRNITIKDENGYLATGIINPATNSLYTQLTLTR
ncbi:hypothetical protein K6T82_09520 [Flavobacterium sp. 17A]|uniref:Uncharacterized protein n=1 Tax=Flavobacterium potami TaxID=2872310 RepID=A0A9X1KQ29_9FLAO|nr:hypothetical protein [Flavobacterium potami]MBZ4035004.1 hypothetical protein [Flavobacterium potami]